LASRHPQRCAFHAYTSQLQGDLLLVHSFGHSCQIRIPDTYFKRREDFSWIRLEAWPYLDLYKSSVARPTPPRCLFLSSPPPPPSPPTAPLDLVNGPHFPKGACCLSCSEHLDFSLLIPIGHPLSGIIRKDLILPRPLHLSSIITHPRTHPPCKPSERLLLLALALAAS
jgi:hypothetical protein